MKPTKSKLHLVWDYSLNIVLNVITIWKLNSLCFFEIQENPSNLYLWFISQCFHRFIGTYKLLFSNIICFRLQSKIITYVHNALLKNFEYFSLSVFTFVNISFIEIHIRVVSCLTHRQTFLKYWIRLGFLISFVWMHRSFFFSLEEATCIIV